MTYERLNCRLCGGPLFMVLELAPTPLANSFPDKPDSAAERIPLQLMECPECHHVQMKHVADAEVLFSDYKYSTPEAFRPHLEIHARKLMALNTRAARVLEIGSNNNLFVDVLRREGFERVVGVDPASPDERFQRLFTSFFAKEMKEEGWQFDLILANNVFAHIDNLGDVFEGINVLLAPEGSLIFEVQYLPSMMESGTFDMIYHEHHDYHTLNPLVGFLSRHGLVMTDYEFFPVHGGSVRVTAKRTGKAVRPPREHLDWTGFRLKIEEVGRQTRARIGKRNVVAFGATAKACTLIHQLGIADRIAYCFDETPQKQGRFIPGTDIPIVNEMGNAKTLFLTAWNYEEVIRKRFPEMQIITPLLEERKAA